MCSHDQGTLEPEDVERKIWQYFLILDQAVTSDQSPWFGRLVSALSGLFGTTGKSHFHS